jgi:type II secretory pathway predicted ATPase ExeA
MTDIDGIWDRIKQIYQKWGIDANPFTESIAEIDRLRKVFTGRDNELTSVLNLLQSANRSRILIYGDVGIGKTSFIKIMLDLFDRRDPQTLTSYISLPNNTDLATAAIVTLARKMPDNDWAQALLHHMGLIPAQDPQKQSSGFKAALAGISFERKSETQGLNKPQIAALSFEDLLDRAFETYDRVIIAIDDLDKQDPSTVKDLLLNAQGILKGRASFILTGHPSGLTQEILLSNRGLFDRTQQLTSIDIYTTKLMLLKYLNSVRREDKLITDLDAFHPFRNDAVGKICQRSIGSPRILNRIGNYALAEGVEQNLDLIDSDAIERAIVKARKDFRDQFNSQERLLIDNITSQGVLSDSNISLKELQQLGAKSFNELLPILEELHRRDLIERLPNDGSIAYRLSPLLLPAEPPQQSIDPQT